MPGNNYFDLLGHQLSGVNLIEASAGTGKTYTITGLYLRLLLEKGLEVKDILVVTFSEAATEELKDRIRKGISKLLNALNGSRCSDKFYLSFMEKIGSESEEARKKLKQALINFDEANIFTIHSFCRRMLHENAFESGILFDVELIQDESKIKREIVEDYWRKYIIHLPEYLIQYISKEINFDSLLKLAKDVDGLGNRRLIPETRTNYIELESALKDSMLPLREILKSHKDELRQLFTDGRIFKQNMYNPEVMSGTLDQLDDYVNRDTVQTLQIEKLEKFTLAEISRGLKARVPVPDDEFQFFACCEDLIGKQNDFRKIFPSIKTEFVEFVEKELAERKKTKNVQSFNDLLFNLYKALKSENGERLAKKISDKYKTALIDEFQDTDPIQFDIFKNIFTHQENILFLIGDPKQAIYGFRGADIFAYLKASQDKTYNKSTLGTNYRSHCDLIGAVNTVFKREDPFVFSEIEYSDVKAPDKKDRNIQPLMIDNNEYTPMHIWKLTDQVYKDSQELRMSGENGVVLHSVAAEIQRLLELGRQKRARIGDSFVKEKDFAVLVKTNYQAAQMQQTLMEFGIPSVIYNSGNVFDSHEATEIERLLSCIAEPNNSRLIKAALATDIMGYSYEYIDKLSEDENTYEMWLEKFRNYNRQWHSSGFMKMFRQMLNDASDNEKIMPRLMKYTDGDRRNTNILHLMESLHKAETDEKLSPQGLLKWMHESIHSDENDKEEHQLRLESDEKAVKVITIHKSKGLEYSIVFVPFMWFDSSDRKYFIFHDKNNEYKLTWELGSDNKDDNLIQYQRERLAEDLRLFYVAVTRAKNCCYIIHKENSSQLLQYLFSEADKLKEASGGCIDVYDMPAGINSGSFRDNSNNEAELKPHSFTGTIDNKSQIASYTSMLNRYAEITVPEEVEALSEEENETAEETFDEGSDIAADGAALQDENKYTKFTFTKGQRAGLCLHEILECADFSSGDLSGFINKKLNKYRFDTGFTEAICGMIEDTLHTKLNEDVILSCVPSKKRIHEMEFFFPLGSIRGEELAKMFKEFYKNDPRLCNFYEYMRGLRKDEIEGFMNGLVDVFFEHNGKYYVADWKSNHLGNKITAYNQNAILREMKEHLYILQYHIYCVAVHKHLKSVKADYNYETDFGGVFYLFLRGMDQTAGAEYGVFYHKPPAEVIEKLEKYLEGAAYGK